MFGKILPTMFFLLSLIYMLRGEGLGWNDAGKNVHCGGRKILKYIYIFQYTYMF